MLLGAISLQFTADNYIITLSQFDPKSTHSGPKMTVFKNMILKAIYMILFSKIVLYLSNTIDQNYDTLLRIVTINVIEIVFKPL